MKRRKKKQAENLSEATGKVGQQKPPVDEHHPEPLMPAYETGEQASEILEPADEAIANAVIRG